MKLNGTKSTHRFKMAIALIWICYFTLTLLSKSLSYPLLVIVIITSGVLVLGSRWLSEFTQVEIAPTTITVWHRGMLIANIDRNSISNVEMKHSLGREYWNVMTSDELQYVIPVSELSDNSRRALREVLNSYSPGSGG